MDWIVEIMALELSGIDLELEEEDVEEREVLPCSEKGRHRTGVIVR